MADADARKAAIKKASSQVQSGGAFVRRASGTANVAKPQQAVHVPARSKVEAA
jgi:hypothetical protein